MLHAGKYRNFVVVELWLRISAVLESFMAMLYRDVLAPRRRSNLGSRESKGSVVGRVLAKVLLDGAEHGVEVELCHCLRGLVGQCARLARGTKFLPYHIELGRYCRSEERITATRGRTY